MLQRSQGFSPLRVLTVDRNNYCYHVCISTKASIALTGTHYRVHLRKSLGTSSSITVDWPRTAAANRTKSTNKLRTDTAPSFFTPRVRVETSNQRREPLSTIKQTIELYKPFQEAEIKRDEQYGTSRNARKVSSKWYGLISRFDDRGNFHRLCIVYSLSVTCVQPNRRLFFHVITHSLRNLRF